MAKRRSVPVGTCGKCRKSRPEVEFYIWSRGLSYYCKGCFHTQHRIHYQANKGRLSDERRKKRLERKLFLIQKTGGACVDCGIRPGDEWPVNCFDFHHLKGKDFTFSQVIHIDRVFEALLNEIENCVLVCANCHRRRHVNGGVAEGKRVGRPCKEPSLHKEAQPEIGLPCAPSPSLSMELLFELAEAETSDPLGV